MKKELEQKLFEKYPKLFRQKDLPMNQTCMCWGIACGNGWYDLIDTLCSLLQWDIDKNGESQIEATQVKEKYGTLRFYTTGASRKQSGFINFAEYVSTHICENCGSTKNVKITKGWITCLCEDCMKKEVLK